MSKYGSPFEMTPEMKRHANRQRLEVLAYFAKKAGDKRPLKDIAADISLGEMGK